jgi:hypothetical protein
LRIINDRVFIVLSKLRYAANAIVPLNKFPPELLRAVFSHLCPDTRCFWKCESTPPYADLLAVGRVCRRWREISVSATELWTHIILAGGDVPEEEERFIARLCMRRFGVQPLDFFYTIPFSELPNPQELIPDRRRLRSLVYHYRSEDSRDELVGFLLAPSRLERLEICANVDPPLPTLSSDTAPPGLWELTIWSSTPWPNHQFGSLTSLSLLRQRDVGANIYSLLDTLRCSPLLEELVLERGNYYQSSAELQRPQKHNALAIPLRSLKRLHVCRLSVETTRHLLGALDLPQNGIFARFTNVSTDLDAIFPEMVTPDVSPSAATKVELIYPHARGAIIHATNGVTYTRLAHLDPLRYGFPLDWVVEKSRGKYPLKEFWLHLNRKNSYYMPSPRALRDLETLTVVAGPIADPDHALFRMLSPHQKWRALSPPVYSRTSGGA